MRKSVCPFDKEKVNGHCLFHTNVGYLTHDQQELVDWLKSVRNKLFYYKSLQIDNTKIHSQ